jgi:hypothetical protein
MNTAKIDSARKRLDEAFEKGKAFVTEPELQSHWARYLCVLVSGFLETSVRTLYYEYAKKKSGPLVSNYVESQLSWFQNAKMEKILQVTRDFSPAWEESLRDATKGQLKDSVDSVVANRHKIAHGESVGISFSHITQYYKDAVKVVELIEEQCKQ